MPEFLALDGVKVLRAQIESAIVKFLESVHQSWSAARDHAFLVLTGGGANLPIAKELAGKGKAGANAEQWKALFGALEGAAEEASE